MRRISLLLTSLLITVLLCMGVSAEPQVTSMNVHAVVASGGDCQITTSVTVHLDQGIESLQFPLPKDASHISLNGSWAHTQVVGNAKQIDLTKAMSNFAGDFSFTVTYALPDQIRETEDGLLELHLPMMSGFAYPTQALEFSITLPGNAESHPGFSSGYHQANIEQDLSYTLDGAVITGKSEKVLKDHETLEMILPVTEEMFPRTAVKPLDLQQIYVAAGVAAAFAFLYWLVFLRCLPAWGPRQANPPEGYSAGQLHSVLALQGADLSMMVFTWAQLGYLMIELDRKGHVRLYRRMEMGNERSIFERRCFTHLFGSRQMVDTSGSRYGELARKVSRMPADIPFFVRKRSGNRKVFRFLCSLIGMCCGVGMGIVLGADAVLQWPMAVLLAVIGFAASYTMQTWISSLFSPSRSRFWGSMLLTALWMIPAAVMGHPNLGLVGAGSGLLGGLLLFCGGHRTAAGRVAMNQVFGLYRYLFGTSPEELRQICSMNPEYFFDLAPYALALGVDMRFAKHFRDFRLPACPYIRTARTEGLTALQWCMQMRKICDAMQEGQRGVSAGHALRFLRSITR